MANLFSDILTDVNNDVIVNSGEVSGNVLVSTSSFNLLSEPSVNDVLFYCDLPSNCKIKSMLFFNPILDSGGTVRTDIGIYAGERIVRTDGTVFVENEIINGNAFSTASFIFPDGVAEEEIRYDVTGSAFINLGGYQNSQLALWELAGIANLPEDPFKSLRIGLSIEIGFGVFVPGASLLQVLYTGKI